MKNRTPKTLRSQEVTSGRFGRGLSQRQGRGWAVQDNLWTLPCKWFMLVNVFRWFKFKAISLIKAGNLQRPAVVVWQVLRSEDAKALLVGCPRSPPSPKVKAPFPQFEFESQAQSWWWLLSMTTTGLQNSSSLHQLYLLHWQPEVWNWILVLGYRWCGWGRQSDVGRKEEHLNIGRVVAGWHCPCPQRKALVQHQSIPELQAKSIDRTMDLSSMTSLMI